MINNLLAHFVHDHGYLLRDKPVEISHAKTLVDGAMSNVVEKTGVTNMLDCANSKPWKKERAKIRKHKTFLSLVNVDLREWIESVVGPFVPVKSTHIAVRFPGEVWDEEWHIDNFVTERRYQPSEFTCIVGVYLADNMETSAGNFTVFPGAHHRVENFNRTNGGLAHFLEHKLSTAREEMKMGKGWEIVARAGTAVLAHRMLPHTVAPNKSEDNRYVVWFRVTARGYDGESAFTNIWESWPGVCSALSLKPHPEAHAAELAKIETLGLGAMVTCGKDYVDVRVRHAHGEPNLFASMVSVRCTSTGYRFHTNGYICKAMHARMVNTMLEDTPGASLFACAEWISRCNYEELIERWVPYTDRPSAGRAQPDRPSAEETSVRWTFHHLHSRSKSAMMRKWAAEMKLDISIIRSKPGQLEISGGKDMVSLFTERFKCLYWNKKPVMVCPIPTHST